MLKSSLSNSNIFEELMPECHHMNWTIADALEKSKHKTRFPLTAFNHVSREVIDLEKSKNFYCDILGFHVIPRPPFDAEGYWLYGNNLNLHLIKTRHPKECRKVKIARMQHYSATLPAVDHIAFLTTDIDAIREILDAEDVYYKFEEPKETGIRQIFVFDPDGNVIEISNCAPPVGETTCFRRETQPISPSTQSEERQSRHSEDSSVCTFSDEIN